MSQQGGEPRLDEDPSDGQEVTSGPDDFFMDSEALGDEQEYLYGTSGRYNFRNEDLQDIYASCCQSEIEVYYEELKSASLLSQVDAIQHTRNTYIGDCFALIEDCIGAQADYVYNYQLENEDGFEVEVSDDSYLFEWVEDAFALDAMEIIEEPTVVMLTDEQGKSVPMAVALVQVRGIQGSRSARILRVLFDTGSSCSLAHKRILPHNTHADKAEKEMINTAAGLMEAKGNIHIDGLRFPEFDRSAVIKEHSFKMFDANCKFDLILGADFLKKAGIDILYKTLEVSAFGVTLPMSSLQLTKDRIASLVDNLFLEDEIEMIGEDVFTTQIADARYEDVDLRSYVKEYCTHLNPTQRDQVLKLLLKHKKLFDGSLGEYDGPELDIELVDGAKPVWRRPYPIPHKHLEVFRKELNHLVEIGVLAPAHSATSWALPTFIIPKKPEKGTNIQRVRWVSDLRELNKVIVRRNYPLPIITDVLRKHHGYQFATCLDLSMQFYCFKLSKEAQDIAVINTPFGPYKYLRAPMGMATVPSFAQAQMEKTLMDIQEANCYIDDVGIFSKTWEEHLEALEKVLSRLKSKGFTCNPLKCEFGVKEVEWLGYIVTPDGLKPNPKKVDAIVNLQRPRTAGELRSFLGLVNFYRDLFPRRSHLLSAFYDLTNSTDKRTHGIPWTKEHDQAFAELKAVVAKDALMAFPNHNKPFYIYTDSSDKQMGSCIMQLNDDGITVPVAYYSKKLNPAQMNYSTMEKELLSLVMTLKEYRSMLLGAELHCFTDHKNLTFANLNSQRVLRWRAYVEEYDPKIYYLEGKLNVVADAYSRLPRFDGLGAVEGKEDANMTPLQLDPMAETLIADAMFCGTDDVQLYECLSHYRAPVTEMSYMNMPSTEENPLRYSWLLQAQQEDQTLMQRCNDQQNHNYSWQLFKDITLGCYCKDPSDEKECWKIVLPDQVLEPTIDFYHKLLNHPGQKALLQALRLYYHPNLAATVRQFHCHDCQFTKSNVRGFGHLPPRDVNLDVWQQVDCDLIGPWTFEIRGGKSIELFALTCIDRASGFPAASIISTKTSKEVADAFHSCWLSLFPRPEICASDNGGEFIGPEFEEQLYDWAISHVQTTARNPTGNGIVERMHLSMGNSLRVLLKEHSCQTIKEARNLLQRALDTALHAVRSNVSESTGNAPGSIVFGRDMFHNVKLDVNMDEVNLRRQIKVDKDTMRANAKRYSYDYTVGQRVLKRKYQKNLRKLSELWEGPYTITQIHVNGNVTIALMTAADGTPTVTERINIRRLKPYKEPTASVPET